MKRSLVSGLFVALASAGLVLGCGATEQDPDVAQDSSGATCGNGSVDASLGETCDTAIRSGTGICPTSCPSSGDACRPSVLMGAGTCTAACAPVPVAACRNGDGCCAPGCTALNDSDCATCGNGAVDIASGETCDTAIVSGAGACPTSCASSGDACNPSVLVNAGTCTAACAPHPITACQGGDGCCPSGCTSANDSDCGQAQLVDTTGTWFTYTSGKGTLRTHPPAGSLTPAITDSDVTVNTWVRSYTSPQGDTRFNICRLEVTGTQIRTIYTANVIATMQASAHTDGALQVPIGSAITLPSYTIYSGQTAAGVPVDAVPPPFPAGDGDGHPGVTVPTSVNLPIVGWQPFNAYSGIAIATSMSNVRVTGASTKTGMTTVTTHGVNFGSDNQALGPTNTTFDLTFNDGSIPFTATKVAADDSTTYSCAYLAQHYPQ